MRKYSKKGWDKRKEERKGYAEFFEKHIDKIRKENLVCEETGARLKGTHNEIAHILPKSYFKSIATDDENVVYLCEEAHYKYDNGSNEEIRKMNIFPKVQNRFESLQGKITERLNWKHFDRWQL